MSYALSSTLEETISDIESRLAQLITTPDPVSSVVAGYEPVAFGGEFPAASVFCYQTSREPVAGGFSRSSLPHAITLRVSFYHPSLRDQTDNDGRATAYKKCRHAASAFRDALHASANLTGQVREIYISSERWGDMDAQGRSRIDGATGSILWVHTCEVEVVL